MAIIQIENVRKEYGETVVALDSISMSIEEGQIFGLVGSNGAGKTTLIRTLVGTLSATNGSVSVLGIHPRKDKSQLRKQIGYMPQHHALYEDLTPNEILQFFGSVHRIKNVKQKSAEILEFLDLQDRANSLVHTFSGGMKKKVSLACTLLHEPKLLFLDEPTAAIDPLLRDAIWNTFRELKKKGTTIVLSTHSMEEALKCDQVALLHSGKVLLQKTPEQIMKMSSSNIAITKDGEKETLQTTDITQSLHELGLDSNITDIAIKKETLEDIVIKIITESAAK